MTSNRESNEFQIKIYPNPVSGKVTLTYSDQMDCESWTLFSVTGAKIIEGVNGLKEMDVSNLGSGLYLLNICNQVYQIQVQGQ